VENVCKGRWADGVVGRTSSRFENDGSRRLHYVWYADGPKRIRSDEFFWRQVGGGRIAGGRRAVGIFLFFFFFFFFFLGGEYENGCVWNAINPVHP